MKIPNSPSFIVDFKFNANLSKLAKITKSIKDSFKASSNASKSPVDNAKKALTPLNNLATSIKNVAFSSAKAVLGIVSIGTAAVFAGNKLASYNLQMRDLAASTGEAIAEILAMRKGLSRAGLTPEAVQSVQNFAENIIQSIKNRMVPDEEMTTLLSIGLSREKLNTMSSSDIIKYILTYFANEQDTSLGTARARNLKLHDSLASIDRSDIQPVLNTFVSQDYSKRVEEANKRSQEFRQSLGELSAAFDDVLLSLTHLLTPLSAMIRMIASVTNFFFGEDPEATREAAKIAQYGINVNSLDPQDKALFDKFGADALMSKNNPSAIYDIKQINEININATNSDDIIDRTGEITDELSRQIIFGMAKEGGQL